MKLACCSYVDISCLKNALLYSPDDEEFIIRDIKLSLDDLTIWLDVFAPEDSENLISFRFSSLGDWQIQLR